MTSNQSDKTTIERGDKSQAAGGDMIYLARQPIFDENQSIFAYELLFRDSMENRASFGADGFSATSQTMLNAIMEFNLARLVDDKLAFFNFDRRSLLAGCDLPLNPDRIGLDIVEDVQVDDEIVAAVSQLHILGYIIALDGFSWRPGIERLLEFASLVKIDLRQNDVYAQIEIIKRLKGYPVKMVAKSVETREHFEQCKRLGFKYFQGFFLCQPTTMRARRLPENRLQLMRLLAKLQDPEVTPEELEDVIRNDVGLYYRLLRTVNSAYYGLAIKIKSVRHAIVYLGVPAVRSWARLQGIAGTDGRPNELMRLALIRARMCELMTGHLPRAIQDTAFTAGLFSILDSLMDLPMEDVLEVLPLEEELVQALARREGPYGRLLNAVIGYERGAWDQIDEELFPLERLKQSYLEAVAWATEQHRLLGGREDSE